MRKQRNKKRQHPQTRTQIRKIHKKNYKYDEIRKIVNLQIRKIKIGKYTSQKGLKPEEQNCYLNVKYFKKFTAMTEKRNT